MPSGIIMQSGSVGATQEDIEKVLTANGYEAEKPEAAAAAELVEPKREDFTSDAEFEKAQDAFDDQQEAAAETGKKAKKTDQLEEEDLEDEPKPAPRLSRRQRAAQRTAALEREVRALKEQIAKGQKTAPPAPELKAPKRDDFKTDAEFETAVDDYKYKTRRAKEDAEAAHNAVQNQLKKNLEHYNAATAEFKETHEDWDDVVDNDTPISDGVYLAILELENGPAVTYYLGTHPAVLDKLNAMSPHSAVMEIGRLADRLKPRASQSRQTQSGAPPKPRPRIPEPVKPNSGSAAASTLSSAEAAKAGNYRAFKIAQAHGR